MVLVCHEDRCCGVGSLLATPVGAGRVSILDGRDVAAI